MSPVLRQVKEKRSLLEPCLCGKKINEKKRERERERGRERESAKRGRGTENGRKI